MEGLSCQSSVVRSSREHLVYRVSESSLTLYLDQHAQNVCGTFLSVYILSSLTYLYNPLTRNLREARAVHDIQMRIIKNNFLS
jgi:hypothetical protein